MTRGVFLRPAPGAGEPNTIDWKTCLLSIQHIMGYDVHIGGMTALALQGYSHYLPLGGNAPVWVYGEDIPSWLARHPLNALLETRTTPLFSDPAHGHQPVLPRSATPVSRYRPDLSAGQRPRRNAAVDREHLRDLYDVNMNAPPLS